MTPAMTQSVMSTGRRTIRRKLDGSPTKIPNLRGDGGAVRPALRRVAAAMVGSTTSHGNGNACGVAAAMVGNTASRDATTTMPSSTARSGAATTMPGSAAGRSVAAMLPSSVASRGAAAFLFFFVFFSLTSSRKKNRETE
jgi:hypothetical protein